MGVGLVHEYGTEPELLQDYARRSDLGRIALGNPGIVFTELGSGAPLRVIAIEDDPTHTDEKRAHTIDEFRDMGLEVEETEVTQDHELVRQLIKKRCRG